MKKTILTVAILAGMNLYMNSQTTAPVASNAPKEKGAKLKNATPEERAKANANHAEKKLGLSVEQKTKWEAAALARINANAPHREKLKGSTTPEERKEIHKSVKANIETFDNTVTAFLTPEQKTKFAQMKEEKKKHVKDHAKGKEEVHQLEGDD